MNFATRGFFLLGTFFAAILLRLSLRDEQDTFLRIFHGTYPARLPAKNPQRPRL